MFVPTVVVLFAVTAAGATQPGQPTSCDQLECSHSCVEKGELNYICTCPEGLILQADKRTCKDSEGSEACDTEGCNNAANNILKWLNPEVNPCEDFYEFTCGNWRNLPLEERKNTSIGSRGNLVQKYIPDLIKDPTKTNGNKHFEKLRNFMIACTDEDTIHSLGVTPIKQLIQKAGGWPVLNANWSKENWDLLNADIALGGVLIDVDTTYNSDGNSSETPYYLTIKPSSLIDKFRPTLEELIEGLENNLTKAYYDSMVDVAVAFGADKAVAGTAMMEVLKFETAFIKGLPDDFYGRTIITFKDFQEAVPWMNVTKLLKEYLPESFQLLPEKNIIGNKAYFLVLKKFIDQYPSETFVNYMVIKAVYPLLDYVHHELNIPIGTIWYDEKFKQHPRLFFCGNFVGRTSLGAALAAYTGMMYADASKVASEMTRIIIEDLSKEVAEIDWMDEVTRKQAAKQISEIKTEIGIPTDLAELDILYKGYDVDTSNYFEAVIYDKKWRKQRDFDNKLIFHTGADDKIRSNWLLYSLKGIFPFLQFNKETNTISGSESLLYFIPLFDPGNPAYVNYGQFGTVVAREIFNAVDLYAKQEEIYAQKEQCFVDIYSTINDSKTTQLKLNGTFTKNELADNGGFRLSLGAYRKLVSQLGSPERKLPRLQQYSTDQLFMISVANTLCEIPYKEKRQEDSSWQGCPLEFKLKGIMMNSPEFSEIFNCNKNDAMNPPDKCKVW